MFRENRWVCWADQVEVNRSRLGEKAAVVLDDEREIWVWADRLIREHGKGAILESREIAKQLLSEGDHDGYAMWRLIIRAIETLERRVPLDGETLH